jgi:hypothetical protein
MRSRWVLIAIGAFAALMPCTVDAQVETPRASSVAIGADVGFLASDKPPGSNAKGLLENPSQNVVELTRALLGSHGSLPGFVSSR